MRPLHTGHVCGSTATGCLTSRRTATHPPHVYVPIGAVAVVLAGLLAPAALNAGILLTRRHKLDELHMQQVYGFLYMKYK